MRGFDQTTGGHTPKASSLRRLEPRSRVKTVEQTMNRVGHGMGMPTSNLVDEAADFHGFLIHQQLEHGDSAEPATLFERL